MAVAFTRAITVAPGDPITKDFVIKLAAAYNDRLRSGIADGTWRIYFWLHTLFRWCRMPDESWLRWPSEAEFFEVYQQLEASAGEWPEMPPGLPEGANVSNPLPAFVLGNEALAIAEEAERLAVVPLTLGGRVPQTLQDLWELGKLQRGAYDPRSGEIASPVQAAADSAWLFGQASGSLYGRSYGGYVPTPEWLGPCADGKTANWVIFFTRLADGYVLQYPGTCPEDPTHVAWVADLPTCYLVHLYSGATQALPKTAWIEGPYTAGARLCKRPANHIDRVLRAFIGDFRGSEGQLAKSGYWLQEAFDFEGFWGGQDQLAPAAGRSDGEVIQPVYPAWLLTAEEWESGEIVPCLSQPGDRHTYATGAVLTGAWARASGLRGRVRLALVADGATLLELVLQPGSDGASEVLATVPGIGRAAPAGPVQCVLLEAGSLAPGGSITVEATELRQQEPSETAYVILRLAAAQMRGNLDGSGRWEEESRAIWEDYRAYGCIRNRHDCAAVPASPVALNTSAVFDAARRLSQCVRVAPRGMLAAYAVEDGKSILWLRRYNIAANGVTSDVLRGLAPAHVVSGELQWGRAYRVVVAPVEYNGRVMGAGDTFTAERNRPDYQGGSVIEADGIRASAPPGGESNEWLLDIAFAVYSPSESSFWKPSVHADRFTLIQRCHFYSHELIDPGVRDILIHVAYGDPPLHPESPSGYNYMRGLNAGSIADNRAAFFRSCRVYEPPAEIESAVSEMQDNGEEWIKLTCKARLHSCPTAPASISRDIETWLDDFHGEPWRSWENGIREYLWRQAKGINCPAGKIGDAALDNAITGPGTPSNSVWHETDAFGGCYPRLFFTRLIPKPYESADEYYDERKTPLRSAAFAQMELYLRAMCEGYIDGVTTQAVGCDCMDIPACQYYDYTFEHLCYEAFRNRWFRTLPAAVAPANAQGFGPAPNTACYAEIANQFALAVNLLTRARVDLPCKCEVRNLYYGAVSECGALNPCDEGPLECSAESVAAYITAVALPLVYQSAEPWSESLAVSAWEDTILCTDSADCGNQHCSGTAWQLHRRSARAEWRWTLIDAEAINAIPETWRDQYVDGSATEVLARLTRLSTRYPVKAVAASAAEAKDCVPGGSPPSGIWHCPAKGEYYKFPLETVIADTLCQFIPASGTMASLPATTGYAMYTQAGGGVAGHCNDGPASSIGIRIIPPGPVCLNIPLI